MSGSDWSRAQEILEAWPAVTADMSVEGTCRRLRDALVALPSGGAGWRDVAVLVRQVLLEHEARRNVTAPLAVPIDDRFPSRAQWTEVGCQTVPHGQRLLVTAAWSTPAHDADEDRNAVDSDLRAVYAGRPLDREACAADPFWTHALGHDQYLSLGQRQAARTVVLAPPGSTTIISMPTGNGKTDVALAAALPAGGVSVVVVPTVVLALDMERRLYQLLESRGAVHSPSRRYSYTSGMADVTKSEIISAIRSGRQRIVFTSPEALLSGLNAAVADSAAQGHLRFFVIDEAHLVEHWGTEFRPEFQAIAAQLQHWREVAPAGRAVRTIAMSATLSDRQVSTLRTLFGATGPTALVWSSETRREPSYHIVQCGDEDERVATVLDAITKLPRPMTVYVTRRDDATAWMQRLRAAGMRRIVAVTGDSSDTERRSAVEQWRGEGTDGRQLATAVDVVIGTSAFGLGVDMASVRTVVHACQPETLDRYYQEVGRAGRDRRPSVAFIATAPNDRHVAASLNRQIVIGDDRGWDRWDTMLRGGSEVAAGVFEVDIDVWPSSVHAESRENRQWNVRTLNLVSRAGLARLESPRRGQTDRTDTGARMWVTLLHGQARREEYWSDIFMRERSRVVAEQRRSLEGMNEILGGSRCVNKILADHYRTSWNGGRLTTAVHCRGCPWCRSHNTDRATDFGRSPFPSVARWASDPADPLTSMRRPARWLSIWWDSASTRDDLLPELIEKLVRRGMAAIGGPGVNPEMVRRIQRAASPAPVIVDHDHDLLDSYPAPLIWIMDDTATLDNGLQGRLDSDAVTYLIHPRALPAPDRPGSRLIDICRAVSVRTAMGEL